jgi:hypothetical protein
VWVSRISSIIIVSRPFIIDMKAGDARTKRSANAEEWKTSPRRRCWSAISTLLDRAHVDVARHRHPDLGRVGVQEVRVADVEHAVADVLVVAALIAFIWTSISRGARLGHRPRTRLMIRDVSGNSDISSTIQLRRRVAPGAVTSTRSRVAIRHGGHRADTG